MISFLIIVLAFLEENVESLMQILDVCRIFIVFKIVFQSYILYTILPLNSFLYLFQLYMKWLGKLNQFLKAYILLFSFKLNNILEFLYSIFQVTNFSFYFPWVLNCHAPTYFYSGLPISQIRQLSWSVIESLWYCINTKDHFRCYFTIKLKFS